MTVTTLEPDRLLSVQRTLLDRPDPVGFVEGFGQAIGPALRTQNTVGSLYEWAKDRVPTSQRAAAPPGYDPFENLQGYEEHANAFIFDETPEDVAITKNRIDRETADNRALGSSGAGGYAAMLAAGVLDPMLLVPVGGAAALARGSWLARGLLTARAGATAVTAAELALHATQSTRTWGQSAENVAMATLLSGVLGWTLGAIKPGLRAKIEAEAAVDLGGAPVAGAAGRVPALTAQELASPAAVETKLKGSFGVAEALGKIHTNPNLWVYTQVKSDVARNLWGRLFTNPFRMTGEAAGAAATLDAELAVHRWRAAFMRWQQADTALFTEYRMGQAKGRSAVAGIRAKDAISGAPEGFLTRAEWKAEVSRAANRNDTHAVPQIQQSAKNARVLLDKVKEEYNALGGKIADEVVGAESYFPHRYNLRRLVREREPFKALVKRELFGAKLRAQDHLAGGGAAGADQAAAKGLAAMSDAEMDTIAEQAFRHILGLPEGLLDVGHVGAGGPLYERKITVPFDELDRIGVLETDAEKTLRSYIRTMAPEIELRRVLGGIDADGSAFAKAIQDDYARLMEESPKDRQKLADNQVEFFDTLRAQIQILLGTYRSTTMPLDGPIVRTLRGARRASGVALGGQFAISSLSDAARITMVNGLSRTFGSVIKPLVRDLHGLRLSAKETQLAGAAADLWLDTGLGTRVFDIADEFGQHSRFERGLEAMSEATPLVSGLTHWTQGLEVVAGATAQTRIFDIAEAVVSGARAKASDVEYMRHLGLSDADLRAISKQEWLHRDALRISQTDRWTDAGLIVRYHAAVRKAVWEMIPRPGLADRPRFMSDEWGKLLLHLKGFAFGAANRVLVANLQQRDAAVLIGSLQAMALGMVTYATKRAIGGYEIAPPEDWKTWVKEGADRGNLLGIVADGFNIVDRATGWAGAPVSRYAGRNLMGTFLGPSFGQAQDFTEAVTAGLRNDFNAGDVHRLRRLAPWQSHWALSAAYDQLEKGTVSLFDIPERKSP